MLALGAQASEAVLFRQRLHWNVMLRVLAPLFEVVDLLVHSVKIFPQLTVALLKPLEFRFRGVRG